MLDAALARGCVRGVAGDMPVAIIRCGDEAIAAETRVEARVETRVEPKPKTPELVLALLSAEPDLTLKEVALRLDKATSTIERAASGLVKAGRLRFVGPRKRGRWELL